MNKIGWIGLGQMGVPMAQNILKSGNSLHVFNRTPEKAAELVANGAVSLPSPKAIAETTDVIFLMLTNGAAVKEVLTAPEGLLAGLREGQLIVDMSTIAPSESMEFAQLVASRGARYMDAPVSGSVGAAVAAALIILAGGTEQEVSPLLPLFSVLGKKVIPFGSVGKGSSAKLMINLLLGITGQAIGETMFFAEVLGLEQAAVTDLISSSGMNTPLFQVKKDMFRNQEFPSQFMLELMAKDLGLITAEINSAGLTLPLAQAANATYAAARDHGKGKLDMAAVYLELKEQKNCKG